MFRGTRKMRGPAGGSALKAMNELVTLSNSASILLG